MNSSSPTSSSQWLAKLGRVALVSLVALTGCAGEAEDAATSEDAIVDVPQTAVERQTISNCWLYAHGSWVESMYVSATGRSFDVSQSYWTYWHWLDKIAAGAGNLDDADIAGSWETANGIIRKYGLIDERTFLRADNGEASDRQKAALAAINASLSSGALKTAAARRDRVKVRAEMDRVFGLGPAQKAMLDRVFGADARRNFTSGANNEGSDILRADQFPAAYSVEPGRRISTALSQAMSDWRKVDYTGRPIITRIQRALHDENPVYASWLVDTNALEKSGPLRGTFRRDTWLANGPGRQGIHMTVLEDYEATLADGTLLPAGRQASEANLARALERGTDVKFFRVKNSWGKSSSTLAAMPGYHDLYLDYLTGSVGGRAPLRHVYLPRGY